MPPAGLVVLLVSIALPLTELALLIKTAQVIGGWLLLAIILCTAALGVWVLQLQGMTGFRRISEAIRQGKAPLESMMDGSLMLLAGFCLIAPGLITDTIGLLLLVPPIRTWTARALHDWMTGWRSPSPDQTEPRSHGPHRHETEPSRPSPHRERGEPPIIEGEFERIDERPIDPRDKPPRHP